MALTPTITSPQARVLATAGSTATEFEAPQARTLAVANIPAERVDAPQARVVPVARRNSQSMRSAQARVLVVARGRVYNPKLRAWPYTLDGHDMYVLRLGDTKTLIFDLLTGEWPWFTSGDLDFWRPNIGMNWYSAGSIQNLYGSNIICGDDTFGHLWVLDPEQGYDDYAPDPPGEPQPFPRIATGQIITRERKYLPVNEVYLTASGGSPALTGDTVDLEYSDDVGRTWISAGAITVSSGDFTQQFSWQSLGLIGPPGRLFRITDGGAFARIDGLDCRIGGARGR